MRWRAQSPNKILNVKCNKRKNQIYRNLFMVFTIYFGSKQIIERQPKSYGILKRNL